MKGKRTALPVTVLLTGIFLFLPFEQAQATPQPETIARSFVEGFVSKDGAIVDMMDAKMRESFGAERAAATADAITARGGKFLAIDRAVTGKNGGYSIVLLSCSYDRIRITFRVVIDGTGKVAGFFVADLQPREEWRLPPYAKAGSWRDEEVEVGAPGWPLKGSLSIPSGKGPFPAVVLVQGSGPSDRDETIGPNKIFADIAAGLASQGIAVLRYDKRTLVYADKMAKVASTIGVREETVDDAVAALAFVSRDSRIDVGRVFLLGHSLGAMLAPMIGADAKARKIPVAGLVMLAPPESPLEDVIVDQFRYLYKEGSAKAGSATDSVSAADVAKIEEEARRVKELAALPSPNDPSPSLLPLGIPASWWRSIAGYDPLRSALGLGLPLLVIHGSRDYQVRPAEAALWEKGLAGTRDARALLIVGLNHLMLDGKGPSGPAEYQQASHVDRRLIEIVSDFILARHN